MNKPGNRFLLRPTAIFLLGLACGASAFAEEEATYQPPPDDAQVYDANTETSSIGRSDNVESKLTAEFTDFLGSEEKAASLVEGLRTGEEFQLDEPIGDEQTDAQQDAGSTLTDSQVGSDSGSHSPVDGAGDYGAIDPPTDTMGYGNVRLTLKLAEAQLSKLGISQPSNQELSAMLVGGEIDGVHYEGILNERAAGAGWGEIAQRYDFKVGQLMGKAPASPVAAAPSGGTHQLAGGKPSQRPSSNPTDKAVGSRGLGSAKQVNRSNGYIPSGKADAGYAVNAQKVRSVKVEKPGSKSNGYIPSGSSKVSTAGNGSATSAGNLKSSGARKNGYIPSGKTHGSGAGIVSAHGSGVGARSKANHGQSKGHTNGYVPSGGGSHSVGIVSANNASTAAAVSSAGGRGHAKGHGKQK